MKRFLFFLLILVTLMLTACGSATSGDGPSDGPFIEVFRSPD